MQHLLPKTGFVRLSTILQLIPVGRTTFWQKVKDGKFPQPVKLGPKTTAWKCEEIHALIESFSNKGE